MARINAVPSRRSRTNWLWIVLAIVAVLAALWALTGSAPRTDQSAPSSSILPPSAYRLAVAAAV
jgi:hypothetical protein